MNKMNRTHKQRGEKGYHTLEKQTLPCGEETYVLIWNKEGIK